MRLHLTRFTPLTLLLWSLIMGLLNACAAEVTPIPTTATTLAEALHTQVAETISEEPTAIATVVTPTSTLTPKPSETPSATPEIPFPQPSQTPDETATPSPTVGATQVARVRVVISSIYIRRGPGTVYGDIGYLSKDDEATILARNKDGTWFNILTKDDVNGWVAASVIELIGDGIVVDSVQLAATIPASPAPTNTPTPTATPTETPRPSRDDSGSSGDDKPDPPDPPPTENPYP